jgi:hypothetical protein
MSKCRRLVFLPVRATSMLARQLLLSTGTSITLSLTAGRLGYFQLDSGEWFGFAAFYDPAFRSADRAVAVEAQGEGHRR